MRAFWCVSAPCLGLHLRRVSLGRLRGVALPRACSTAWPVSCRMPGVGLVLRCGSVRPPLRVLPFVAGYLVDPASSHMLVSKIKPCMSKYKRLVL